MAMNLQKIILINRLLKNIKVNTEVWPTSYTLFPKVGNGKYCNIIQPRKVSTYDTKSIQKTESQGFFKSLMQKIPFINLEKTKIKVAGYLLYEDIADKIDYATFIEQFGLRDTFYSWFVITELYIWMLSVRAMAEGEDGKLLRASIVEALWNDVARRVKKLGASNPGGMREHVYELHSQLQAAFISYDEGLQSDDIVLAGALWRRFYQKNYTDPLNIEKLVKYVRKQIVLLDNLPRDQIFRSKAISWEPITK